MIATPRLYN